LGVGFEAVEHAGAAGYRHRLARLAGQGQPAGTPVPTAFGQAGTPRTDSVAKSVPLKRWQQGLRQYPARQQAHEFAKLN
jgi:hypothetical protein